MDPAKEHFGKTGVAGVQELQNETVEFRSNLPPYRFTSHFHLHPLKPLFFLSDFSKTPLTRKSEHTIPFYSVTPATPAFLNSCSQNPGG
jgi:hypothetical protein